MSVVVQRGDPEVPDDAGPHDEDLLPHLEGGGAVEAMRDTGVGLAETGC